ncbi:MAG: lipase family protein [Candidatus Kuenenia sp.]|nr:lipase family protein [Candidatus Kuenenia hertensis]
MKFTERDILLFNSNFDSLSFTEKAYLMAKLSGLAYLPFEKTNMDLKVLNDRLKEIKIDLVNIFNNNGTQAYLAKREDNYFLVFRGTELDDYRDLIADLDSRFYETIDGKRHRGFYRAFNYVKDAVLENIPEYFPTIFNRIYIVGHSLGGAIAKVAADEIYAKTRHTITTYTFGSPKHNDGTTELYGCRFVNAGDPIPAYPFNSEYKHTGDLCFLKGRKIISDVPFLDRLFYFLRNVFMKRKLFNRHSIESYCKHLERIVYDR